MYLSLSLRHKLEYDEYADTASESEEDISFDDWTLLDCCFGIPLFNSKLNREVCDKILDRRLLDPQR